MSSARVKSADADLQLAVSDPVRFKTALEFAMATINDPLAEMADKVRLAIAAMPFQHGKIAEIAPGKKEQAEKEALKAAEGGSGWGSDLAFEAPRPN